MDYPPPTHYFVDNTFFNHYGDEWADIGLYFPPNNQDLQPLDPTPTPTSQASQHVLIDNVSLNLDERIYVARYEPANNGGYKVEAYQVIDEATGNPIIHPLTSEMVYIHGGDQLGIASMNFDLVYNASGYVVGLVDDVRCQSIHWNNHTNPPSQDCWQSLVLFTEPYRQIEGIHNVLSYLETDFSFYTSLDNSNMINRRVVIMRMYWQHGEQVFESFHVVTLGLVDDEGRMGYRIKYDNGNDFFYNTYLMVRDAVVINDDYFGMDQIDVLP